MNAHQPFISDAAHQLRTPAAAVQSMAESLRHAPSEKDRVRRTEELISAARASTRVTEQLLSLDRLSHRLGSDRFREVDLTALMDQLCSDVGPVVMSADIDFVVDLPDPPIPVSCDQVFVSEAVKNLIDNALKLGGEALSRISVKVSTNPDGVEITVLDAGKGLATEDAAAPFGRVSRMEPSDGSGLGVAIVSSIAQQHGGTVPINRVESGASLPTMLPRLHA